MLVDLVVLMFQLIEAQSGLLFELFERRDQILNGQIHIINTLLLEASLTLILSVSVPLGENVLAYLVPLASVDWSV